MPSASYSAICRGEFAFAHSALLVHFNFFTHVIASSSVNVNYWIANTLNVTGPSGVETSTSSPLRLPKIALPTGDSLEIRLLKWIRFQRNQR